MIWIILLGASFLFFSKKENAKKVLVRVQNTMLVNLEAYNEAMILLMHPKIRPYVRKFMNEAKKAGFDLRITESYRSSARQAELYAQGRNSAGKVINHKLKVTDAPPGISYHEYGLAFDVYDKIRTYSISKAELNRLRSIAVRCGLEYIDWDGPHFQKSFGKSPAVLKAQLKKVKSINDLII